MSAIVQWFEPSLALSFFGTGTKADLFQSCGHCWVFQICWHIEYSTFTALSELCIISIMQSTSCEMPGLVNHKLESRLRGEISITSDMQMTSPLWQKAKRNWRASWWKAQKESEKVGLKLNIQKRRIIASSPIISWQIDVETMETVTAFILLGWKITANGDCSHKIRTLAPWKKSCNKPRQHIKKQRHFANKSPSRQSYGFSSSHVWMWELGHKEGWAPRIDVFVLWCWRRLFRVPWTARRSNQSIWKEINPEYSLEGLLLTLHYLGHLMQRGDSFEKTLMLGKIEGRRGRGWTEDEMVGWHHWLNGHEFAQSLGDSEGQGSLECCSPWGHKEPYTTEQRNNRRVKGQTWVMVSRDFITASYIFLCSKCPQQKALKS